MTRTLLEFLFVFSRRTIGTHFNLNMIGSRRPTFLCVVLLVFVLFCGPLKLPLLKKLSNFSYINQLIYQPSIVSIMSQLSSNSFPDHSVDQASNTNSIPSTQHAQGPSDTSSNSID